MEAQEETTVAASHPDEPHQCAAIQTTMSQLKAEAALLRPGCQFAHIADSTDLVSKFIYFLC